MHFKSDVYWKVLFPFLCGKYSDPSMVMQFICGKKSRLRSKFERGRMNNYHILYKILLKNFPFQGSKFSNYIRNQIITKEIETTPSRTFALFTVLSSINYWFLEEACNKISYCCLQLEIFRFSLFKLVSLFAFSLFLEKRMLCLFLELHNE